MLIIWYILSTVSSCSHISTPLMPPLTPSQFCNYTPNYHGSCSPRRVCTTISIHRSNFSLEANWKTKSVGPPFVGRSFTPDPAGEHTVLPACCPLPSHSWYVAPHCVAHQCFWPPVFILINPCLSSRFSNVTYKVLFTLASIHTYISFISTVTS